MKIKLFAAVLGVLVALGVISIGTSLAQSEPPVTLQGPAGEVFQTAPNNPCQAWEEALAKQLGVSVEKLQQAQKSAAKEMVDLAVKNGRLTAEQATKMKERIDAANFMRCPEFFGGRDDKLGPRVQAALHIGLDAAAKALNMTPQQLMEELRQGKSVATVAKEKGVALETVKKAIVDAETAKIDEAVKNGKITAEQAAKLKADLSSRVDQFLQAERKLPAPGKAPGRLPFPNVPRSP